MPQIMDKKAHFRSYLAMIVEGRKKKAKDAVSKIQL